LSVMGNYMTVNDVNLQAIAEHYLVNIIGLTAEEMNLLKRNLAGSI